MLFHCVTLPHNDGRSSGELLSSWLVEQEVRGSIPGLAAIRFQRLVISCFQVATWLKYRYLGDVNPKTANYNDRKSSFYGPCGQTFEPNASLHLGVFT